MFEPTLMIRVVALRGRVPVEAFLRAARELAVAASEVARAATTTSTNDALPLNGGHVLDSSMDTSPDGLSSPGMTMPPGWCIIDAQCSGPSDIGGASGATNKSEFASAMPGRHSVALVIAPPSAQRQACQQVREGMRLIQARCEERPAGFTDAALRSVRRLALLSARQLRVSVSAGQGEGEAIELDANTVAQIDAWLRGEREALGSVEGSLDVISIHNRLRFTVYERGSSSGPGEGARIECLFPQALLGQVKTALGERVCIRGRVRYRKDGVPAIVEAHWLRVLRPLDQLPSIQDMIGCAR
jgi:hypothetical protein